MSKDIRICFVGDSFVNGTGDEMMLGWSGRLCAAASRGGIPLTYYNLGVRRNTSEDILLNWEVECARRLPDTCDGRLVLSCGVNDTVIENGAERVRPEASRSNVRAILCAAQKYKLLVVGPPPVVEDGQNERIHALTQAFSQIAAQLDVPYVELFAPLVSDADYIQELSNNDGSHPRGDGYAKMANIVRASPNWWFQR
jgi:lysophospholipase L1-like esterase